MKPTAAADQTQTPETTPTGNWQLFLKNLNWLYDLYSLHGAACQINVCVLPKHGTGSVNFAMRVVIQRTYSNQRFGEGFVLLFQCRFRKMLVMGF